jgi:serine/threonine-protein kinase
LTGWPDRRDTERNHVPIGEGQTLGNYQVLQRIGVGGMGSVFLAEHPLIGKRVALKVIHGELAGNREVITRFFNEARVAGQIGNDHIVEVHDFGQSPEGDHFFIMEFLAGRTLAQVLHEEGVLPAERVLHIAAQIASGLGAAHARGILHRDLKPDNIMLVSKLGDPDFVKILDFGLAKCLAGGDHQLTARGVVLGTPQYMAPEVAEGKGNVDFTADVYSLGVLMFQMLVGRVPFGGDTMGEILVKHVSQPPPAPRGINPSIPPSVEQIVLRCLAKQRDRRFPSMEALRQALLDPETYLASSPPIVPAVASPEARTLFERDRPLPPAGAPPPPQPAAAEGAGASRSMTAAGRGGPSGTVIGFGMAAELLAARPAVAPVAAGAPVVAGAPVAAAEAVVRQRRPSAFPELQPPAPVQNRTMVISTPTGFASRPPRVKHFLLAALALALLGALAFLVLARRAPPRAAPAAASAPVPAPAAPVSAGAAVSGAAPATARPAAAPLAAAAPPARAGDRLAVVRLRSVPSGAEVFDADGKRLGQTPAELAVRADGRIRRFTLRHPEAREETLAVAVDGDEELTVELKPGREPAPRPRRSTARRRPARQIDDGVLQPDFF